MLNSYGITETGSWVAGTSLADLTPEDGLVGGAWGAVMKVLKTGHTGAAPSPDLECPPGETGYVWIHTPSLMKHYLNREDLTNQAVCRGWLPTGDIGLIDERGLLYLRGREREEINKSGLKIYPADIDSVVERFPETADVTTFGFDDPVYGQEIAMALVLKKHDGATIRELYDWMRRHLAEHKMPRRWYLMDAVPRSSRGKIDRNAVMERCAKSAPLDLQKILPLSDEKGALNQPDPKSTRSQPRKPGWRATDSSAKRI